MPQSKPYLLKTLVDKIECEIVSNYKDLSHGILAIHVQNDLKLKET